MCLGANDRRKDQPSDYISSNTNHKFPSKERAGLHPA